MSAYRRDYDAYDESFFGRPAPCPPSRPIPCYEESWECQPPCSRPCPRPRPNPCCEEPCGCEPCFGRPNPCPPPRPVPCCEEPCGCEPCFGRPNPCPPPRPIPCCEEPWECEPCFGRPNPCPPSRPMPRCEEPCHCAPSCGRPHRPCCDPENVFSPCRPVPPLNPCPCECPCNKGPENLYGPCDRRPCHHPCECSMASELRRLIGKKVMLCLTHKRGPACILDVDEKCVKAMAIGSGKIIYINIDSIVSFKEIC